MPLEELRRRYDVDSLQTQLDAERQLLAASFARATQHKALLGAGYETLAALHADAEAVYAMDAQPLKERKAVLYTIYTRYFGLLAALPYKTRRHFKADSDMKALKRILKTGGPDKAAPSFWPMLIRRLGPSFVLLFAFELLWVDTWDNPASPPWLGPLAFVGFVVAFAVYVMGCYNINGLVHHSGLHKWLRYKATPETQERPTALLQYLKMGIPLAVAFGSAMIKLYFQ